MLNTVDEMLIRRGITEYCIQRVDFRIDNYKNIFDEVYKINNIIVNLLAMSKGVSNCYKALKNDTPHNIVTRGKGIEVECYDREEKEGKRNGLTKTRLELRNIFPYAKPIPKEHMTTLLSDWMGCLNHKLMEIYYRQFQAEQNKRIIESWNFGTEKGTVRNYIDLLARNKDVICTGKQMGKLCDGLGLAKDVSYTYKSKLKIGYYSYGDIMEYISKITGALNAFLRL